jgi:hypothetical protein
VDEQFAEMIGIEGYTYLYPLVLMDLTRLQVINTEKVSYAPLRVPADTFLNIPVFPPADLRVVVRPNFDTLYSTAFLDLRAEPRIVSVPPAGDNYYLLPFYDMFGEVFACPGIRTTGGEAGDFAIVGPGWSGDLPSGVRRYDAPTSWVWIIGRTEASVATYDKVHAFQAGLKITAPAPAREHSSPGTPPLGFERRDVTQPAPWKVHGVQGSSHSTSGA